MPNITVPCPPFWSCGKVLTLNTFGIGAVRLSQEGATVLHQRGYYDLGSACNWDSIKLNLMKRSGTGVEIDRPAVVNIEVWYGERRVHDGDPDRIITTNVPSSRTQEIINPECQQGGTVVGGDDVFASDSVPSWLTGDSSASEDNVGGFSGLVPGVNIRTIDARRPDIADKWTNQSAGTDTQTWDDAQTDPNEGFTNGAPTASTNPLLDNPVLAAIVAFVAIRTLG
jgi:hypothetical protein